MEAAGLDGGMGSRDPHGIARAFRHPLKLEVSDAGGFALAGLDQDGGDGFGFQGQGHDGRSVGFSLQGDRLPLEVELFVVIPPRPGPPGEADHVSISGRIDRRLHPVRWAGVRLEHDGLAPVRAGGDDIDGRADHRLYAGDVVPGGLRQVVEAAGAEGGDDGRQLDFEPESAPELAPAPEVEPEPAEEPEEPCDQAYGDGIEILGGSYLELNRFQITKNNRVGLLIFDPTGRDTQIPDIPGSEWISSGSPEVKLSNGSITENLIGVNIQAEAIDLDSDFTNVLSYDNLEINLSTDNMAVPGPADALESAMGTP